MRKSIKLLYTNDSHRGPGKVVQNLLKGLRKIGVTATGLYDNNPSPNSEYIGCLQYCFPDFLYKCYKNNIPVLMGPNLFVLPTDNPELCRLFKHFVVPSEWVKNLYVQFSEMNDNKIHIWPVGIDTDKWAPVSPRPPWEKLDCFIYFKNRSEKDLAIVEALCKKFELKYKVLKYGFYEEDELYRLCQLIHANDAFVILLTGTESQGIAYLNMLSFGIPCYVFNNPSWKSDDNFYQCSATAVPYFHESCGEVVNNVDLEHFSNFLQKNREKKYNPRSFVIDNLSLEKQAKEYYSLLQKINEK